jgi:hypothetical protein
MTDSEKIEAAIKVALRYGSNDAAHHLRWVIDQMLRKLMGGDRYDSELLFDDTWDKGCPP